MSIHYLLFWLLLTAAFGKSDLGMLGVVVASLGLAALGVAIVGIVRKPSRQLLWLLLPIAVTHVFLQVVDVWQIGDHHEMIALSIYAIGLFAAVVIAGYFARANRLAAAGGLTFALVYAWFTYAVSLFVFWNGFR